MIYDVVASDLDKEGWPGFKQYRADAIALEACILEGGHGDYLEVGVRMGGSAIFAGFVKKMSGQRGEIYGIDCFGEGMASKGVTPEGTLQRCRKNGIDLKLTVANSNPWPLPDVYPVVALIDGSHRYEDCLADWNNLKTRAKRFILFHDYKPNKSVAGVVDIAKQDPSWRFVDSVGIVAIFERYHKAA